MYKAQIKFQKIICFVTLAASFLVFLYSLGIMTDIFDSLYPTMIDPEDYTQTWVTGSVLYYDMQPFNYALTRIGIGLILISLVLFVTSTHKRRRYYFANIFATILNTIAGIAAAVYCLPKIKAFKIQFLTTVNFEELKFFADIFNSTYTESTFWLDISVYVFAILLVADALLVCNLIWKFVMMHMEKALIKQGKEN